MLQLFDSFRQLSFIFCMHLEIWEFKQYMHLKTILCNNAR